jgi:RNA polymerase sigma factor (sigma-70 family)
MGLARALGIASQRAPDVAQEAVLLLLGADEVRHPRAWLRTVVRRLVARIRRERREENLGESQEELLEPLRRTPELSLDVEEILARLRRPDRIALLMCLAGFKQREIGRHMGWSVKSVGSRILRAQARARSLRDRVSR